MELHVFSGSIRLSLEIPDRIKLLKNVILGFRFFLAQPEIVCKFIKSVWKSFLHNCIECYIYFHLYDTGLLYYITCYFTPRHAL